MSYFDVNTSQTLGLWVATFKAVSVSAAQDAFSIVAPADRRVGIRLAKLGQYSDFGDAQAELLSALFVRGNTTAGSGGGAFTPLPLRSWFGAAGSTVRINDTTVATSGTEALLDADVINVAAGLLHRPEPDERIWLAPSERLCLRITAPADALTMNGTLLFEETSA